MLPSATASTVVAVVLHSATATTVDAVALGSTMEHYGASIRCYGIYQSLLMFYAHDRRKRRWIHKDEKAKPYAKGEGHSLMVADFVSVDYGWMASRDKKKTARILFRAGKGREGFFTNENIRAHLAKAAEILNKDYPDEDHVLIFDNAKTHAKRAEHQENSKLLNYA